MDGGDILTGRPYGYTEEYQSYEQTGTEQYQTGTTPTYGPYWNSSSKCSQFEEGNYPKCKALGRLACSNYRIVTMGEAQYWDNYFWDWKGSPCQYQVQTGSTPTYGTRPVYGYVTRTRTVTYDKQSGLFSIGIGVPYAALNNGLYSTRKLPIEHRNTHKSSLYILHLWSRSILIHTNQR